MNCPICLKDIGSATSAHEGYHIKCLQRLFGTTAVSPRLEFDKKHFSELSRTHTKGMSISGAQVKLSMKIENKKILPTATGGEYILKPSPWNFENTSENEHVSMLIGSLLGVDTPPIGLVQFSDGELAYIIKRFDREEGGKKIHQEDLAQIIGIQREKTGEFKYSGSYEEAANTIFEASGGKLALVLRFFERIVYNFVIGNGDFHLKNVSLVRSPENKSAYYDKLTPNYDSLHTKKYSPGEREFALSLLRDAEFTQKHLELGFATKVDFLELAKRIKIGEKAAEGIFDRLKASRAGIDDLIGRSYLPPPFKEYFKATVADRYRRLFDL